MGADGGHQPPQVVGLPLALPCFGGEPRSVSTNLRSRVDHRLRAAGFMDLVAEALPQNQGTGAMVLSLCNYFVQHGDLCQDPEMVVRVFPPRGVRRPVTVVRERLRNGLSEDADF